jgi:hypothetical protein
MLSTGLNIKCSRQEGFSSNEGDCLAKTVKSSAGPSQIEGSRSIDPIADVVIIA